MFNNFEAPRTQAQKLGALQIVIFESIKTPRLQQESDGWGPNPANLFDAVGRALNCIYFPSGKLGVWDRFSKF
jgi:hypothetical protein